VRLRGKQSRRLACYAAAGACLAMAATACAGAGGGGGDGGGTSSGGSVTLRIAIVANPQMQDVETLTSVFEKQYPNIKIAYDTLPEDQERAEIQQDIATNAGLYDVVMISNYETPLWAKNGWLDNLTSNFIAKDPSYDVGDLISPIAQSLSYQGGLYSAPFYGESSFLMYRKDMFAKAGLAMPLHPTWQQVATLASKLNDPKRGVAGICLRGEEGWGENLAPLDTVINTFGGSWFNTQWQPQLTSPQTAKAVNFYVNLIRSDGEPGAASDGFTELLTDYNQGKCAMWYDATSAAGDIQSASAQTYKNTGYAWAPTVNSNPSGWLYTWSLGIPKDSRNAQAAWTFVSWATSKAYIKLVGQKLGWAQVPPGSRASTYSLPQYQQAAGPFADLALQSIQQTNPEHPTVGPVPYTGVQFVDIPQFENLGTAVSQQISAAITGNESVPTALANSQQDAIPVGQQNKTSG
jgi:sorbitol/mannitol transport system substrate-binding protein